MRCANLFRFLLGFYGPGEQQLQMWSGLQCRERERNRERERKVLSLRVCILDFSHLASASTVVSLVQSSRRRQSPTCPCTWHLIHGQGKSECEGKGSKKRRVHTARHCRLAIALLLAGAGVYLMPTVLACCPRQIWHWLFKLSDREFVVTC